MNENVFVGFICVIIAGVFAGSFSLPMKFTPNWKWQHNWMIYTMWAMLITPLAFSFYTVPNLISIYLNTDILVLLKALMLGMAWGVGSVCFGLGLEYLGVALGMTIMFGLIITIGSILPIVLYHPEEMRSSTGLNIILASVILTTGVVITAIAGGMKNKKSTTNDDKSTTSISRFKIGIIIAILAGVLGPFLNIAFISGNSIKQMAIQSGINLSFSGNAVWPLVLFGGFCINFGYCAFLITKNKEWKLFANQKSWYWFAMALSGLLWYFCIFFFGLSSDKLGKLGASIGWAAFQSLAIIIGNFVGVFTGEWKNTQLRPKLVNLLGIVILIFGIYIIAS